MSRCKGRSAYTTRSLCASAGKTEARLEHNEPKNGKAANGKTLPSHQTWFRERKFRGNITLLQLFLIIKVNIWFESS